MISVYTPKNFMENQFGIFNKSGNTIILLSRISCHECNELFVLGIHAINVWDSIIERAMYSKSNSKKESLRQHTLDVSAMHYIELL